MVTVGETGVHVSFEGWVVPVDVKDNSTIVAAVTTLGIPESEGAVSLDSRLSYNLARSHANQECVARAQYVFCAGRDKTSTEV